MPTPLPLSQKIIDAACIYYQCNQQQLQTREYIEQRKIVCYLLRNEAMLKYKRIQIIFNQKNHSALYRQITDIEAQKNVIRSINTDIKNIKQLAGICE